MNQNDQNRQPRMITQEEIERVNHISPEELQRTQVINLKDVQEAVKFEKRTSKKPAIILGIIGITLLLFGSGVQIATSLKENRQEERIEQRKEIPSVVKSHLSCNKTKLNNNGMDSVYTFSYDFEDNELVKETKIVSVVPTPGNTTGTEEVKKSKELYKKNLNQSRGYTTQLTETEKGFTLTTEIDYTDFDETTLNANQKNDLAISVDYKAGELKENIREDMLKKEFICQ